MSSEGFPDNIWPPEPSLCTRVFLSWQIPKLNSAALWDIESLWVILAQHKVERNSLLFFWLPLQAPWNPHPLNSFRVSPHPSAFLPPPFPKITNSTVNNHLSSIKSQLSVLWIDEHKLVNLRPCHTLTSRVPARKEWVQLHILLSLSGRKAFTPRLVENRAPSWPLKAVDMVCLNRALK